MSEKIVITHKKQRKNARKKNQKSKSNQRQNFKNSQARKTFTRGPNQPIARTNRYRNRGAIYKAGPNGTLTVKHTEYIKDIVSDTTSDWNQATFYLNPGDVSVFPWLNKLATNYEKYIVDEFIVHYEPVCSTTVNGGISMLIDYDASDNNTPTKQVFFNSQNATTSPYHAESKLSSTKNQLNSFFKEKSVRTVALDPNNRREYDFGRLIIATDPTPGIPAGTQLGRLFYTYTFTFKIPALKDPTEIVLPDGYPQVGYFSTTGGLLSTSVKDMVTVDGPSLVTTSNSHQWIVINEAIPDGSTLLLTFATQEILHGDLLTTPGIRVYSAAPGNLFCIAAGVKDTQIYDAFNISFIWHINKQLPNWQIALVDFNIQGPSNADFAGNFVIQLLPTGAFGRRDDIWWNMGTLTSMVQFLPLAQVPNNAEVEPPRKKEEPSRSNFQQTVDNNIINVVRRNSLTL